MVQWTISVTDVDTNTGVANAKVCLFGGSGSMCQNPEEADHTMMTDGNGEATFDVDGFFIVGIIISGYESAYEPHDPPEDCAYNYAATGAGGAREDTYDFPVRFVGNGNGGNGNGETGPFGFWSFPIVKRIREYLGWT
jgi:hypothetical protein